MTDPVALATVRLLDGDYYEVHVWTGYLVPPLSHLPNANPRVPYRLKLGDDPQARGGLWQLPPGDLYDVVWEALTSEPAREHMLKEDW